MFGGERKLGKARRRAREQAIFGKLTISPVKGKRFRITHRNGLTVDFGAWPVADGTFLDHGDEKKRANWYARHVAHNPRSIMDPTSPLFYSAHILW